jgi:hypothetical protein
MAGLESTALAATSAAALACRRYDETVRQSSSDGTPFPQLQAAALKPWAGREDYVREARAVFEHRARCNGEARHGRYTQEPEHARAVPA